MATLRRSRAVFAIGALALVPAALTACGAGGAGGQSVADACQVAQDGMTQIESDITEATTAAVSGDAEELNGLIQDTSDEITAISEDITNEEVSGAFGDFATAYQGLADVLAEFGELDMSDPEAATTAAGELTEKMTSASEDLTTASSQLADTCG
ncbi:hypothetical protein [Microbacterium halophytorum]|uniref:hypothetical protein n=1 Tax=Microbacterium halophytorum TaxID=2067568 RepID=UPI000CFC33EE|nr:hypothetical protein [Microbacterium halophytorum]